MPRSPGGNGSSTTFNVEGAQAAMKFVKVETLQGVLVCTVRIWTSASPLAALERLRRALADPADGAGLRAALALACLGGVDCRRGAPAEEAQGGSNSKGRPAADVWASVVWPRELIRAEVAECFPAFILDGAQLDNLLQSVEDLHEVYAKDWQSFADAEPEACAELCALPSRSCFEGTLMPNEEGIAKMLKADVLRQEFCPLEEAVRRAAAAHRQLKSALAPGTDWATAAQLGDLAGASAPNAGGGGGGGQPQAALRWLAGEEAVLPKGAHVDLGVRSQKEVNGLALERKAPYHRQAPVQELLDISRLRVIFPTATSLAAAAGRLLERLDVAALANGFRDPPAVGRRAVRATVRQRLDGFGSSSCSYYSELELCLEEKEHRPGATEALAGALAAAGAAAAAEDAKAAARRVLRALGRTDAEAAGEALRELEAVACFAEESRWQVGGLERAELKEADELVEAAAQQAAICGNHSSLVKKAKEAGEAEGRRRAGGAAAAAAPGDDAPAPAAAAQQQEEEKTEMEKALEAKHAALLKQHEALLKAHQDLLAEREASLGELPAWLVPRSNFTFAGGPGGPREEAEPEAEPAGGGAAAQPEAQPRPWGWWRKPNNKVSPAPEEPPPAPPVAVAAPAAAGGGAAAANDGGQRFRFVQRYRDGVPVGPAKLERVHVLPPACPSVPPSPAPTPSAGAAFIDAAMGVAAVGGGDAGKAWEASGQAGLQAQARPRRAWGDPAGFIPDVKADGFFQVSYSDAAEAVADVQLAGGGAAGGAVSVVAVSSGGAAQRAGVCPGFRVVAVNGERHGFDRCPGPELLQVLLQSRGGGTVLNIEFADPQPRCHGVPSLADAMARRPLRLAPLF